MWARALASVGLDLRQTEGLAQELSRLLGEWDPIGVYDPHEDGPPPGEYGRLVGPILTKLRAGDSVRELAAYLTWDVHTNMGLPGRPAADLAAAEKMHGWFHRRQAPAE